MFSQMQLITMIISAVWLLIFINRTEVRREMLILGTLAIFLMPVVLVVSNFGVDQVINQFQILSLTEMIFTFVLAGIAATIFHAIFGKHYHALPKLERKKPKKDDSLAQLWLIKIFLAVIVMVWTTTFLILVFHLSEITSFFIAALLLAVYITSHRHDLFFDALWSGLLTTFIVFLASGLANIFAETNVQTSELLLFAFALGISLGPLYEFFRRFQLKSST